VTKLTRQIKRIKSSALFTTMVIALIIGILCTLLLLLAYNDRNWEYRKSIQNRMERNLKSAINLSLADTAFVPDGHFYDFGLFERGKDSARIKRERWGLFDVSTVEVSYRLEKKYKSFLIGRFMDAPLDGCLYLAEHRRPLALAGESRLTGTAYLPRGGAVASMVGQEIFQSPVLVDGDTRISQDSLPGFEKQFAERIEQWGLAGDTIWTETGSLENIPALLDQSFGDSSRTYHGKGVVTLSFCTIRGHVHIISDSVVIVGANSILQDVIISAPVIQIEEGFRGRIQAIASDSIIVKTGSILAYPSCLVLVKGRGVTGQPKIILGENCVVDGIILSNSNGVTDMQKTYVEIGKNSVITGCTYVSGYLNLAGTFRGAVLTDYIIYRTPKTVYDNYLVDGVIDRKALPGYFAVPSMFGGVKPYQIVEWVK
jgi:hypothetical protein